jgi:hypothetical protein
VLIEFSRFGRTYQQSVNATAPPDVLVIPFRPCVLRPAFELELSHVATDDVRGIELYKAVREIRP